jgi:hypothetical protein
MIQELQDEDRQLHTLGLLEQLRKALHDYQGVNNDLYFKIDRALRELANPNLHELNLDCGFRIEVWDRYGNDHLRMCIAASNSVVVAHAGFDAALKEYPNDRLTLRNRSMLMRDSDRERKRG